MFEEGAEIVIRNLVNGRVHYAEPAISVSDSADTIAFYRPAGTPLKVPTSATLPRSDPQREALSRNEQRTGTWEHHDELWTTTNVLVLAHPGEWWSAWLMWDAASFEFLAWYVNFEAPLTRSAVGYDTMDLSLDLVVLPDGQEIEKDREEYDRRVTEGLITPDSVAAVELALRQAREAIAAQRPPFDDAWIRWRPKQTWATPVLPATWSVSRDAASRTVVTGKTEHTTSRTPAR